MKRFSQLSAQQKKELKWFIGREVYPLVKNGSWGLDEILDLIIEEIRSALDLLNEHGAEALLVRIEIEEEIIRSRNSDGNMFTNFENIISRQACNYVQLSHLRQPIREVKHPFVGKSHLLRLTQNRGNPDFKEKIDAEEVRKIAEQLVETKGWRRYVLKRVGPNNRYPGVLLHDIAKLLKEQGITVSTVTVRRRLVDSGYRLPTNCLHPMR